MVVVGRVIGRSGDARVGTRHCCRWCHGAATETPKTNYADNPPRNDRTDKHTRTHAGFIDTSHANSLVGRSLV